MQSFALSPHSWRQRLLALHTHVCLVVLFGSSVLLASEQSIASPGDDENCDSGYWTHVQEVLRGHTDVSAEVAARLAADEAALEEKAEGAGCEVGRLILSSWQLVHADVEERVWHLQRGFGVGFYAIQWTPRAEWPVFHALAKLSDRVLSDPPGLYTANSCDGVNGDGSVNLADAESKFLNALTSNFVGRSTETGSAMAASAAASFLSHVVKTSVCPLALGVAFWSLAAALLAAGVGKEGGECDQNLIGEVNSLLREGEDSMRRWGPRRLPFIDMLTTKWPLFSIGARLERLLLAGPRPPILQPSRLAFADPVNPRCTYHARSALVEGLSGHRVEAVVVFGRRERVEILHRYLLRNARHNGGVLDRVMFVVFQATTDDIEFLGRLVREHEPYYLIPPVTGRRLAKFYSVCTDTGTVYVKIDDDVVYIADEAIPEMVRERLRGRCAFVSANVVNHAILSSLHQDIGAVRNFFPPDDSDAELVGEDASSRGPRSWIRSDDSPPMSGIIRHAQSDCVWKLWECAAWMHESLLSRLGDGTSCAYDFGWHDFHAHGHGNFRGDKFVPLPYARWSINMIAFTAEDLVEARQEDLAEDDESELSYMVPHRMGKRGCAVGKALVAHFSYSLQDDGLMTNTDLLERYNNLSRVLTGL